jgi:hypothetical protein
MVLNDDNELIPSRTVTGWRVCIDYRKLNDATQKYHFPLPFIDQMLERLSGYDYYCFLDGFSVWTCWSASRYLAYFGICTRALINSMLSCSCLRFSRNFFWG